MLRQMINTSLLCTCNTSTNIRAGRLHIPKNSKPTTSHTLIQQNHMRTRAHQDTQNDVLAKDLLLRYQGDAGERKWFLNNRTKVIF